MSSAPSPFSFSLLLTEPLSAQLCFCFLQGTFCLHVLWPQRPGVSVEGVGFGLTTSGTASFQQSPGGGGAVNLPQGLSQESKGRASTLRAVLCHRVRECDVLLPRVVVIMSAQKGLGHHPGQPSHLATESDPRGDRGLPKVTGQVHGRAEAKTQVSCPSASVWSPPTLVT